MAFGITVTSMIKRGSSTPQGIVINTYNNDQQSDFSSFQSCSLKSLDIYVL